MILIRLYQKENSLCDFLLEWIVISIVEVWVRLYPSNIQFARSST